MMEARVAGVPSPVSFMASESSFSSSVLPAVSMAVSSVPSVRRLGARVFFFKTSASSTSCGWPLASPGGRTCSARPSCASTAAPGVAFFAFAGARSSTFQPICCTALPEV